MKTIISNASSQTVSPLSFIEVETKTEPDTVENVTLQIFAHLYEVVDGQARKEIERAITPITEEPPSSPRQHHNFYASRYLLSDSNFLEEDFGYSIHTPHVVQNTVQALAEIFFGWKLAGGKDWGKSENMGKVLADDKCVWKKRLQENYTDFFQVKMNKVFESASELLKMRIKDTESAYFRRLTFYAGLIIASIGRLINQKILIYSGLSGSIVTLAYMIRHYVDVSFRQAQEEIDLKTSINDIYSIARMHRCSLDDQV